MNNIEKFKELFPYLRLLEEPIITYEKESDEGATDLRMNYRLDKESETATFYIFKFVLVTPNSDDHRVELKHGYLFQVIDKKIIIEKHPIFIEFITFLIADSIRFCRANPGVYEGFNLILKEKDLLSAVRNCINTFVN